MSLFRFPHNWRALADRAPQLEPIVAELDDRDRALEDHLDVVLQVSDVASVLAGTTPPGFIPYRLQGGTQVSTPNGSGDIGLSFPTPFPSGVVSLVVTDGEPDVSMPTDPLTFAVFGVGLVGATVRVRTPAGPFNAIVRFNWLALGW